MQYNGYVVRMATVLNWKGLFFLCLINQEVLLKKENVQTFPWKFLSHLVHLILKYQQKVSEIPTKKKKIENNMYKYAYK